MPAFTIVTLTTPITTPSTWTVPANVYRVNVLLVGGGGGGGGGPAFGGSQPGGGGGGGGRVLYAENISVTPGSTISYSIGAGGSGGISNPSVLGDPGGTGGTTSFGGLSVAGGERGGFPLVGTGGQSSKNILGTVTNYNSSTGGGAGSDGNGVVGGIGGPGYNFPLTAQFYGGGGGKGADVYDQSTGRPVLGSVGGRGGGGTGGGEGTNGTAGINGLGGGGGGGASRGTTVTRTQTSGALTWNTSTTPAASTNGGAGGSGAIIIGYDESTFVLTSDRPGVGEGESIIFTLQTVGVPNGTSIPYSISGTNVTAADFTSGSLTGNFVVTSTDGGTTGTAIVTLALTSTAFTEGEETATITAGSASLVFKLGDSALSTLTNIESTTISQQHYNNIRNPLVPVMGIGVSDSGWDMPMRSTAVVEGNRVTATQWSNLRFDITNAWTHLYGSAPPTVSVSEGNTIRANNSTAPYLQYQGFVNNIVANRIGPPHSSQSLTRTANPLNPLDTWVRQTVWPHPTFGPTWTNKLTATANVRWSSAAAARKFFNSGGEIRFSSARTGGTSTPQGNSWTNLLNSVGTVGFGGGKPAQGLSPQNGLNYYRLTNNYLVWYTKETTTPYSNNYFRILARAVNFTSNTLGQEFEIDFLLEWVDDYVGLGGVAETGTDGGIRYSVSTLESFQVLDPASSGNYTVETPTFILTFPIP